MTGYIRDKAEMYRLLRAGAFGNTSPQFASVAEWGVSPLSRIYHWWGVRTLTAGGPCRLYCPTEEVALTAWSFRPLACNVSLMIDAVARCTMMAEIWRGVGGLEAHAATDFDDLSNWRQVMPTQAKPYALTAARMLLRKHLNAASLSDLHDLLDAYPDHVVELSAYETCVGTVPGRNAVVWEVRPQGGGYELRSWDWWGGA